MDWRGDAMLEGCLGCGPRRGGQLDSPWTFLADRGAEERRSGDGCFPSAESRVAAAEALVARSFHHVACGRQGRAVEDAGYAFALADAGSDLAKRALVARGSAFAGQWDLKRALRDADRLAAMGDAAGARRVTCHAGCAAKEAQVAAKQRSEAGREKSAKFPKAPLSVVFHSFRLTFGRAIISRSALDAWMLFGTRARGTLTLKRR
jgi:hypothetical protein